ncbi:tetratricopeptide repeat protein [Bacillus sp. AK031]
MLAKAKALLDEKKYETAKELLENIFLQHPEDPEANFYCGAVNDSLGLETAAIPFYRRAIENGISGFNREAAFIQLGSSYRCIGEYQLANETLQKGIEEFPDNQAMKVFHAMTLYNLDEHKESFSLLLTTLITSSSDEWIKNYKRALTFYSEDIDEVWK